MGVTNYLLAWMILQEEQKTTQAFRIFKVKTQQGRVRYLCLPRRNAAAGWTFWASRNFIPLPTKKAKRCKSDLCQKKTSITKYFGTNFTFRTHQFACVACFTWLVVGECCQEQFELPRFDTKCENKMEAKLVLEVELDRSGSPTLTDLSKNVCCIHIHIWYVCMYDTVMINNNKD